MHSFLKMMYNIYKSLSETQSIETHQREKQGHHPTQSTATTASLLSAPDDELQLSPVQFKAVTETLREIWNHFQKTSHTPDEFFQHLGAQSKASADGALREAQHNVSELFKFPAEDNAGGIINLGAIAKNAQNSIRSSQSLKKQFATLASDSKFTGSASPSEIQLVENIANNGLPALFDISFRDYTNTRATLSEQMIAEILDPFLIAELNKYAGILIPNGPLPNLSESSKNTDRQKTIEDLLADFRYDPNLLLNRLTAIDSLNKAWAEEENALYTPLHQIIANFKTQDIKCTAEAVRDTPMAKYAEQSAQDDDFLDLAGGHIMKFTTVVDDRGEEPEEDWDEELDEVKERLPSPTSVTRRSFNTNS